jgi:hypothetical protein
VAVAGAEVAVGGTGVVLCPQLVSSTDRIRMDPNAVLNGEIFLKMNIFSFLLEIEIRVYCRSGENRCIESPVDRFEPPFFLRVVPE